MATDWDDDQVNELVRLWDAGGSAGTIAKQLGITKNAVLGKIHRLRKAGHRIKRPSLTRSAINTASAAASAARNARRRSRDEINETMGAAARVRLIIAGNGAVIEKPEGKPSPYESVNVTAWQPLPGVQPLPLMRLSVMSCRWPVEIAASDEHHFCGAMKINGPYCLHHARLGKSNVQPTPKSIDRLAKRYAA